jgi:hypothetical protein
MGIGSLRYKQACWFLTGVWLLCVAVIPLKAAPGFSFLIASDLGPNGLRSHRATLSAMARTAEQIAPAFFIQLGDFFHQDGVSSVSDPRWQSLFEDRMREPSLQRTWYGILGNHEYRGNASSVLEYSAQSPYWKIPSQYYTFVVQVNDSVSVRFVFFDTTPLLSTYNGNARKYPEATRQDVSRQLAWADSVLSSRTTTLTLAFGHHPLLDAGNFKNFVPWSTLPGSPLGLMEQLHALIVRHRVDFYFSGHRHNVQHLTDGKSQVQYLILPSGSQPRAFPAESGKHGPLKEVPADSGDTNSPSLIFARKARGFAVATIENSAFKVAVFDPQMRLIYSITKDFSKKL